MSHAVQTVVIRILAAGVAGFLLIGGRGLTSEASQTGRDRNRFAVDQSKFVVVGVGYEPGARPGQYPWERKFEPEVIRRDIGRIKAAGFNTVRNWSGFTHEEMTLFEEAGLWVIQGIWVDPHANFADSAFVAQAIRTVDEVVDASGRHKNVLLYVVMNEPSAETVLKAGLGPTRNLFIRIRDRIHERHPGVPVTFAGMPVNDFMDVSMWDALGFNLYMYAPVTVRVLGYRGYVEWLIRNKAPDFPLVITEFGLSVSRRGEGRFGYGGNSVQDQAVGDIWMWDQMIQGGAAGGCAFNFADGWWKNADKPDDAMTHDDEPEEWYGLIGIENATDTVGFTRPAYDSFVAANRCVWTSPVSWKEYRETIPFEVYSAADVRAMRAEFSSGHTMDLTQNGRMWGGDVPPGRLAKFDTAAVIVELNDGSVTRRERVIVTDWNGVPRIYRPVTFHPEILDAGAESRGKARARIRAADAAGAPATGRTFTVGMHGHNGWDPGVSKIRVSNDDGLVVADFDLPPASHVVTISISTGHDALQFGPTWGDAWVLMRGEKR